VTASRLSDCLRCKPRSLKASLQDDGAGATREEAMYDTAAFQLVMIGFAFGFLMGVLI
jgi:hypothetical protein